MTEIKTIAYDTAKDFLLPRHYSGRIPSISYAYGCYNDDNLVGVLTVGKPASHSLCIGVCGVEFSKNVYELNRLCVDGDLGIPLSKFVAKCLRDLSKHNIILVSYSDTAMNHHGYIYQATNFIYTGVTKQRTDKYTTNGKHSRHYDKQQDNTIRKLRSAKHRYIYFCTKINHLKGLWLENLKYPVVKEYPKGDNSNYVLGEYLKDVLIYNVVKQTLSATKTLNTNNYISDTTIDNRY